jgi:type IV secretion system protein VirB11
MSLMEQDPVLAQMAGPLLPYLEDPEVLEVMVNPDGTLFVERFGQGMHEEASIPGEVLDTFLRRVASHVGAEWRATSPSLHAALPTLGWRLQAEMPPITAGPMLTLRKHPQQVFPLDDFVAKGILTPRQRTVLEAVVQARQTLVVSGSTGSAKTALLNALLHALRDSAERIVVLEDDPELRCAARNTAALRTVDGQVTMTHLVQKVLRHRPSRIVVGEVRDGAALAMLRAFQTGHPGLTSVHAPSARATLLRLEQLVQEVSASPQRALIAEAVNVIVHLERHGRLWRATDLLAVEGLCGEDYVLRSLDEKGTPHETGSGDDECQCGRAGGPGESRPGGGHGRGGAPRGYGDHGYSYLGGQCVDPNHCAAGADCPRY